MKPGLCECEHIKCVLLAPPTSLRERGQLLLPNRTYRPPSSPGTMVPFRSVLEALHGRALHRWRGNLHCNKDMLCILEDMLVVHYINPAVNAVRRAQGGIGSMESIEAG